MEKKLDEFVKNLSGIYDHDSEDTYVTIYYSRDFDTKFIDRRQKAIEQILKDNDSKNFVKSLDKIKDVIKDNSKSNIAVFCSDKNNFLEYIVLPVDVENLLVVDSSPYLRPLARVLDEWESFILVLISTNYANIFSVSLGQIDKSKKISADIMNKHKKGGWSQARFNRLRRGAIHAFYKEVSEALEKINDNGSIILAGPGQGKYQFKDMLSKHLQEKIIDVIDVDINEENEILKKSIRLVSEKEEEKSHNAVLQLKQEIMKDGLAVYGIHETLNAARNGQIEILLIEKDYKMSGWICEHCQALDEGEIKVCPYCGKKTSKVDMLEEILEFAARTDAEIEFTDDEDLPKLGHIAGILRYK